MHLLLTSALYFRGRWLNGFDQAATRKRCFQVPDTNGCYEVSMMENTFKYNYASIDSLDADVIEIPYSVLEKSCAKASLSIFRFVRRIIPVFPFFFQDQRLSMLVFLPHNEGLQSIHTLSRDLSYTPISVILGMLKKTELILTLPKFSIESKHDLRGVLESVSLSPSTFFFCFQFLQILIFSLPDGNQRSVRFERRSLRNFAENGSTGRKCSSRCKNRSERGWNRCCCGYR